MMFSKKFLNKFERAQIIPLLAFGVIVIAAMAALIIDGGALLLNRRSAQNAADAGALAGARVLCRNENPSSQEIQNEVVKFTQTENNAILVDWYFTDENIGEIPGLTKGEIVVVTEVEHGSFFAKLFGEDVLTASATAAAGCFPYRPNVVLPIAWSCRPPAAGSDAEQCDVIKIDYNVYEDIGNDYLNPFPPPQDSNPTNSEAEAISTALFNYGDYDHRIYILMDSDKVCAEEITCDFLPEDKLVRNQLESAGNRGWLNLTGENSNGTSTLVGWIENGFSENLQSHIWLPGIDGNRNSVYAALQSRIDEIVWVPVFNYICNDQPVDGDECYQAAHAEEYPGVPLEDGQTCIVDSEDVNGMHYHIVAFVPFVTTCVHNAGGGQGSYNYECPGRALAMYYNQHINWTNIKTLEGYFVDPDTVGELVNFGADLGVYTVSLTR